MKAILGEYGKIVAAAIVIFIMIGCTSFFKGDYFTNAFDQLEENNPMNWASVTVKDIDGNVVKTEKVKKGGTYTIDYTPATDTILVRMNGGSIDWSWDRNITLNNIQDEQIFKEVRGWEIGYSNLNDVVSVLDDTGILTIQGNGKMNYLPCASTYRTSVTKVIISDGVTSIMSNAFANYSKLTDITIPNSVTTIGSNAFTSCGKLTNITIPDSVSTIGSRVFAFSGICDLTIPDSVTTIASNAFDRVGHITYYGSATGAPWGANSMN